MGSSSSSKSRLARGAQLVFDFFAPAAQPEADTQAPAPAAAPVPTPITGPAPTVTATPTDLGVPEGVVDWKQEATRATRESLRLSQSFWPELALPGTIKIGFRLRGHAAGIACLKPPAIHYNPALLERYTTRFVETIVPHEVAHLVVDSLYAGRVKPHGSEWKDVVVRLGGLPRATHEFETTAARRLHRFYYECACEELHPFTGKSHRRARNGSFRYSCKKCAERLRFSGIEGYE